MDAETSAYPAEALALKWQAHTDAQLIEFCQAGNASACAELDRRGVEPEVLEAGPDPIASLDVTSEDRPNASWLRQHADALKFEGGMLEGHAETYVEAIMVQDGAALQKAVHRAMLTVRASELMKLTSAALAELADEVDDDDDGPRLSVVQERAAGATGA